MVDVLVAHSYYLIHDPKQAAKMRPYAPLAALYAASALRDAGYSVALFDAMLAEGEHEFAEALAQYQPRHVALVQDSFNFLLKMCLTRTRQAAARMIGLARKQGARTVAAGPDVTDNPRFYLEAGLDYALVGEADQSLVELLHALTERSAAASQQTAGLAWLDPDTPDTVRFTGRRRPVRDLDSFPLPAWDLVDADRYRAAWHAAHGRYSVNLVTSRGCPFRCNWCAKPVWGSHYAVRSPDSVADEMALVKRTLRPDHVWFADDIFGLRPGWVGALADAIVVRDAAIPFTVQARADRMTPDTVEALARAGCVEVWLGAESGSQRILDAMDKGTTVEHVRTARARLGAAGVRACFFIQLGYPGETYEDILATARMIRETVPDDIGVSVSYPLPGTPFYDRVRADLGAKRHWTDSGDLAMMFRGTYDSTFYRSLYRLLHRDLDARRRAARVDDPRAVSELEAVAAAWRELERQEAEHRSLQPTRLAPAALKAAPSVAHAAVGGA